MRCAILLLSCALSAGGEVPCTLDYGAVDLTGFPVSQNGKVFANGTAYTLDDYWMSQDSRLGCVCKVNNCMRKCCPEGEFLFNSTACESTTKTLIVPKESLSPETLRLETFRIIYGSKCKEGRERSIIQKDEFVLQADGKLLVSLDNRYYEQEDYCLDYIVSDEEEVQALICTHPRVGQTVNVIGMIISMPFLLATFIVYAALPDRNMHAKSLMCYVITLFLAYFLLVNVQFRSVHLDENDTACKTIGILCLFFFMVSFFWINVMSIDIWWTFSGLRGLKGSRKAKERKRFLLYNGYAWGVPAIIAVIVTSLTASGDVSGQVWYNPGIGDGQCWIIEGIPTLLFFYGPIALILLCNIILFAITAWKIRQTHQETAILRKDNSKRHNYENDKQRFYLYLKLMLAMGTNWSMEIISWAVEWRVGPTPAFWYLTDFCNACYGVFIFFIFVFKRNIWTLLKRRYYTLMGKPNLARSMGTRETSSPRTTETTTTTAMNHQESHTVQYSANNSNVVID